MGVNLLLVPEAKVRAVEAKVTAVEAKVPAVEAKVPAVEAKVPEVNLVPADFVFVLRTPASRYDFLSAILTHMHLGVDHPRQYKCISRSLMKCFCCSASSVLMSR